MLGGDGDSGADVAVGALLRLWESRSELRSCGRVEGWLLRTANRLCIDQLRQDRSKPLSLNDHDRNEPDLNDRVTAKAEGPDFAQTELSRAVRDAVMGLPEPQRAVLLLSTYEGLSYEQISEALEIPAGTVASRRNHALKHLRRRLAAWENP
jgi:RNA polymerase sigma-70 factor (ECF subfamily)